MYASSSSSVGSGVGAAEAMDGDAGEGIEGGADSWRGALYKESCFTGGLLYSDEGECECGGGGSGCMVCFPSNTWLLLQIVVVFLLLIAPLCSDSARVKKPGCSFPFKMLRIKMNSASFTEDTEKFELVAFVAAMADLTNLEWYAGLRVTQQILPSAFLVAMETLLWRLAALMSRLPSSVESTDWTLLCKTCIIIGIDEGLFCTLLV